MSKRRTFAIQRFAISLFISLAFGVGVGHATHHPKRCGSHRACIVRIARHACRRSHHLDRAQCRIALRADARWTSTHQAHAASATCVTIACDQSYIVSLVGPGEGACVENIIGREDTTYDPEQWNTQGSGAYGLGQALPASKMASAGADWQTNPKTQIRWVVGYTTGSYGSPCDA